MLDGIAAVKRHPMGQYVAAHVLETLQPTLTGERPLKRLPAFAWADQQLKTNQSRLQIELDAIAQQLAVTPGGALLGKVLTQLGGLVTRMGERLLGYVKDTLAIAIDQTQRLFEHAATSEALEHHMQRLMEREKAQLQRWTQLREQLGARFHVATPAAADSAYNTIKTLHTQGDSKRLPPVERLFKWLTTTDTTPGYLTK
jgi:hypothetical protein